MPEKRELNDDIFYFDGQDKYLDASYLRKKLCKKRYLLEFERGELLISQGEQVEHCFYLETGSVIAYEIINNRRRIFDVFSSNNLLMCSYALYDRPCALFYEASESSCVYYIRMEKVRKLLQNDGNFTRAFLAQTTRDLLVCQDLLRKSTSHSVSWLVSDFLIVMASRNSRQENGVTWLADRITQNQMADMLFINRITCLNELHKLEDLGLITLQRSRIGIADMHGLAEYRQACGEAR